jgi:hypothetical protein
MLLKLLKPIQNVLIHKHLKFREDWTSNKEIIKKIHTLFDSPSNVVNI